MSAPASTSPNLEDQATYDHRPDRNCDVVMKGGVTSGIVYPRAICQLAQKFRLRSIGGTSAGAIAAACAAAAEYGREIDGAGFARLAGMHTRLGKKQGERTHLEDLFQASGSTRVLMAIYSALAKPGGSVQKFLRATTAAMLQCRRVVFFVGVLIGIAAGHGIGGGALGTTILFALVGGLIATGYDVWHAIFRRVPRQMFGVCTGKTQPGATRQGLIDWLHQEIEVLAARESAIDPLTFRDLRSAGVDLQVMTTCLTHGRPYGLPGLRRTLYFDPDEMRRLFPLDVVDYLERVARERIASDAERVDRSIEHWCMQPRLPLPRDGDLPVLVAVRMSLSFPVLLSAVPLWDYDWGGDGTEASVGHKQRYAWRSWVRDNPEAWDALRAGRDVPDSPPPPERLRPERICFSDGGISSNFPIHLFDAPVPRWPTIGIDLRYHGKGTAIREERRVQLAQTNAERIDEDWARLTETGSRPGTLVGFLARILSSMQNWNDTTLSKVAGYRDRFATVHLQADEGGMNLSMSDDLIESLAGFGDRAGIELRERFLDGVPKNGELNWASHRWTRLRTTLSVFEDWLAGFSRGANSDEQPTFDDLAAREDAAPPSNYRLRNDKQRALVAETLAKLRELQVALDDDPQSSLQSRAPRPRPALRVVPKLSFPVDQAVEPEMLDGCESGVCDVDALDRPNAEA